MAAIPVLGLFDRGVIRKREALMDTAYQVGCDLVRLK
jgi:hypothetical protein